MRDENCIVALIKCPARNSGTQTLTAYEKNYTESYSFLFTMKLFILPIVKISSS